MTVLQYPCGSALVHTRTCCLYTLELDVVGTAVCLTGTAVSERTSGLRDSSGIKRLYDTIVSRARAMRKSNNMRRNFHLNVMLCILLILRNIDYSYLRHTLPPAK